MVYVVVREGSRVGPGGVLVRARARRAMPARRPQPGWQRALPQGSASVAAGHRAVKSKAR